MKMKVSLVCVLMLFAFVSLQAEPPDWEVMSGTQYNMQMYSQVNFLGEYFTNENPGNIVAAFGPDDSCRAIAYWNQYNQYEIWYMTIVSNAADSLDEVISFKIYDAETDQILECRENILFRDNTVAGSFDDAILLTIPYAIDDIYGAYEDSLLTILPASGVLINDEIPQDYLDEFWVVLDVDVMYGTLDFVNDGSFTYQPDPDFYGNDYFEYYATDGVYQTNNALVEIQVQNVNDPPSIVLPNSFTFPEDTVYQVDFTPYISDIDNTNLTLSNSGNVSIEVSIDSFLVTFTPDLNFNGIENITFTINDNTARLIDSDTVAVEVTPVNDAPTVPHPIADFSFNEDQIDTHINLNYNFDDIDGDELEFNVIDNINLNVIIDEQGNVTISTYLENWFGEETIVFLANDLEYSVSDTVTVTVLPVNDPPLVLTEIPDQEFIEDFADFDLYLDDYFFDVDEDSLHYSAQFNNQHILISIDNEMNILTISSVPNWDGVTQVLVTANDRYERYTVTDTFTVTVSGENDPPVLLVPFNDVVMQEDDPAQQRDLNYHFADYDNDPLDFEVDFIDTEMNAWITDDTLYFEPLPDWNGQSQITVTASDMFNDVSGSFNVTVNPVNDAPYVYLEIPDYELDEGFAAFSFNLYDHFADIDSDSLLFTAALSENNTIIVDIVDEILTISSLPQWYGYVDVTVTAQDNFNRLTASDTFTVQVNPINDPPYLDSPINDQNVNEDFQPFEVELSTHFIDPEDDPLTYSVVYNTSEIGVSVEGSTLTISSVFNWFGTAQVTVYASDEMPGNDPAEGVFNVIVQPVNDPPFVGVPLDDQYVDEDFAPIIIDLNDHFVDYDDVLDYDVEYDNELIGASIVENILTISSRLDKFGDTEVSVTASDGNRVTVSDDFWVYIAPVNDAPVILLPDTFEFYEDNSLVIDFAQFVTDVDSDSLLLEATGNDSILIDIDQLTVTFTNVENWNGSEMVTFNVSDEEFTVSDQVQVIVLPEADELTIMLPPSFTFNEDESLIVDFSPFISNPDDYDIELDYSGAINVTVDINDVVVTFGALSDWNGQEQLSFEVSNINGPEVASDFVDVIVLPVNDPPTVVTPIPDQYILEDSGTHNIDLDTYFDDVDGDSLTYSANFDNEMINIDITANMLYFTPETNWNGTTTVTVTAQDGYERVTVSDAFDIIVEPVNDPPQIVTYFNDVTKAEDFAAFQIDFTGYFTDIDGDTLSYSVDFEPEEVDITLTGTILEISSVANWYGSTVVSVTADDQQSRITVTDDFIINVTSVNDIPVLDLPIDDLYLLEDFDTEYINLDDHFSDVDNTLIYYAYASASDISVYVNQNMLEIDSVDDWYGVTSVEIVANDLQNRAVVTDTFDVYVEAVNDAPVVINLLDDITINEDTVSQPVNLDTKFFDIDGDDLVYSSVVSDSGGIVNINDNIMTVTAQENWNGPFDVYITADDQVTRLTVTDTFHVVVMPVNDPPYIVEYLPDLEFIEDFAPYTYDLSQNFADIECEDLYYNADFNSDEISVSLNAAIMQINSVEDWTGVSEVVIYASDQLCRLAVTDTFLVTVTGENDPPYVVQPIPNQNKLEDFDTYALDLDMYFDDIDGDILTYEAVATDTIVILEVQDNLLYLSSVQDLNGVVEITVTADDGQNRLTAEDTFILTISEVNDPPMLMLPDEFTFDEDTSLILDFVDIGCVCDIDNDPSELTLTSSGGEHVIVDINGTIVTFSADANFFGTEVITFSLSDDISRYTVTDTVNVIVNPINDPPVFEIPIPDQQIYEGGEFDSIDLNYYVTDVDDLDAQLNWDYSGNTDLLVEIDPISHIAIISVPDDDWNGNENITFTVMDQEASASDVVNFEVIPVNDAPEVFMPIPDQYQEINFQSFDLTLSDYFFDVDEDELTYSVAFNSDEILAEIEDDVLTISSIVNWYGVSEVVVTADDNVIRATVSDTFLVDVTYTITQTMDLIADWNWISFYVQPEDYSLEYVFSDPLGDNVNTVKYQTETADFYPEIPGWFGDLEYIQDGAGYLVNVDDPVPGFSLTGNRIMSDTPIDLIYDWNWIAYYPPYIDSLSSALTTILDNIDIVKNQTNSAQYVYVDSINGYTWFGDLNVMEPGIGYKVRMYNPDELIYPYYPVVTRNEFQYAQCLPDNSPEDWTVMRGTSDNMIAMLNLQLAGQPYNWSSTNAVGIFDENDVCRAHGIWQEAEGIENGFWYFTIVGNINGTELHLKLMDQEGNEHISDQTLAFAADQVIGSPFEPVLFTFNPTSDDNNDVAAVNYLQQNYPNPFNPVTTISYSLAQDDNVEICVYNLRGEKVKVLVRGQRDAGSYSVIWDGTDDKGNSVASGIYFYSIKTSQYSASRKMVMIK